MTTSFSGNGFKSKHQCRHISHAGGGKREGIETVWDRLEKQQPQCGYCNLGTSCRICVMGPCRIDPFGDGPQQGVCGADADIMVARNLARMMAAGAAAHSDHGRDLVETLCRVAKAEAGLQITDPDKLNRLAAEFGVRPTGKSDQGKSPGTGPGHDGGIRHAKRATHLMPGAPPARLEKWGKTGDYPRGVDWESRRNDAPHPHGGGQRLGQPPAPGRAEQPGATAGAAP